MPFMLEYRSEFVLSIKVALHTYQLTTFREELNNAALYEVLDLLPSIRGDALLRGALYKLCSTRSMTNLSNSTPLTSSTLSYVA